VLASFKNVLESAGGRYKYRENLIFSMKKENFKYLGGILLFAGLAWLALGYMMTASLGHLLYEQPAIDAGTLLGGNLVADPIPETEDQKAESALFWPQIAAFVPSTILVIAGAGLLIAGRKRQKD